HWLLQEAQGNHRTSDVQVDRVANVRQGQTPADGGGSRGFASQEKAEQKVAVGIIRQRQEIDQGAQDLVFAGVSQLIENAARLEGVRQVGNRLGIAVQVVEQLRGDLDLVRGRPLEQLGAVEA